MSTPPLHRCRTTLLSLVAIAACAGCPGASCGSCGPAATPPAATGQPTSPDAAEAHPRRERPAIDDSHVHLAPDPLVVEQALAIFARAGIERFVVKSAGSPGSPRYQATLQLAEALGPRVAFFVNVDWQGHEAPGFVEREVARLEQAMREGASGIKVFKALGLGVRDAQGRLWPANTPRLDPLWRRAGELGAIVALHIGDPRAFFEPPTPDNERYEELQRAPSWSFHGGDYPSWRQLLDQQEDLFRRFPQTSFLGIHLAGAAEDLEYVSRLLERYPNLHVDTSARLGEIGRHPPAQTRAFFVRWADRVLFGSDVIFDAEGMQLGSVSLDGRPPTEQDAVDFFDAHRRFFETDARRLAHPTPSQGRWTIDGIGLPPEVLAKLYRGNVQRLIFARRQAWWDAHHQ